jgi:hypothetical protein
MGGGIVPTIEMDQVGYHLEVASTTPIRVRSLEFAAFLTALVDLDASLNPAELEVTPSGAGLYAYHLELGDGREVDAVLNSLLGSRSITTDFMFLPELLVHNPVIESLFGLIKGSMTSLEVTWT